eukprot:2856049-Rhodomonas_salina.1
MDPQHPSPPATDRILYGQPVRVSARLDRSSMLYLLKPLVKVLVAGRGRGRERERERERGRGCLWFIGGYRTSG